MFHLMITKYDLNIASQIPNQTWAKALATPCVLVKGPSLLESGCDIIDLIINVKFLNETHTKPLLIRYRNAQS